MAINEKEDIQEQIHAALVKLATGYDYKEREVIAGKDGKPEKIKETHRHVPPNWAALQKVERLIKDGKL